MTLIAAPSYTPAQEALLTMQALHEQDITDRAEKAVKAFNLFWRNDRATPAEIAAALGTNAENVFERHAATVAELLTLKPGCIAPEDYTPPQAYTFANDGSMTLL